LAPSPAKVVVYSMRTAERAETTSAWEGGPSIRSDRNGWLSRLCVLHFDPYVVRELLGVEPAVLAGQRKLKMLATWTWKHPFQDGLLGHSKLELG
jgi:hypothetical protein